MRFIQFNRADGVPFMTREKLFDFAAVLFLILLPFVVFWFLWAPNPDDRGIFVGDVLVGAYPSRIYVHRLLQQGELPLWNPYQLGGMPLLADIQVASFYLPNLILDLIYWDTDIPYTGFEALIVAHYAIGAVLMFGYLRNLGIKTPAALLGAIAFEFNGFFVGHHGHYSMFSVVVWVPGALWMLDRAWQQIDIKGTLFYTIMTAFMLCQLAMGGHPQLTYYSVLFISAYFVFRWGMQVQIWRFLLFSGGFRGFITNPIIHMPLILAAAGLIGMGLSAISTLPMIELLTRSVRSEPTLAFSSQFSLMPRNFITLFMPEFLNWSGTEFRIFAGVTTLTLVFVAWIIPEAPKRPEWNFYIGAFIVVLILSMGAFTSVHGWFYRFVPGFSSVRVSARIFYFGNISLVILASFGADFLFGTMSDAEGKRLVKLIKYLTPLIALFILIGIFIYGLLSFYYVAVGDDFYFYETQFIPLFNNDNKFNFYSQLANHYFTFVTFFVCGLAILWMRATQKAQPFFVKLGLLALMTIDITTFGYRHDVQPVPNLDNVKLDGFSIVEMPWWEVQDEEYLITYLSQLPDPIRVDNSSEVLSDNYSQDWEILFSTGYNVLELIERHDLLTRWPEITPSLQRDLLHVHYILSRPEETEPPEEGAELVVDNSRAKVWKRAEPPAYVNFSTNLRPVRDGTAINGYISSFGDDPYAHPSINMESDALQEVLLAEWPEYISPDLYLIGETGIFSPVDISILSGGTDKYGAIVVDGMLVSSENRGIHMAIIDPATGELVQADRFDTYAYPEESDRLSFAVDLIPEGHIVALSIYDEGTASLTDDGRNAILALGGAETLEDRFGAAYGLIGVKGAVSGSALEVVSDEVVTLDVGLGSISAAAESIPPQIEESVMRYDQDEIELLVKNDQKGILTISETVYPGWKVYVNGEEGTILPTNGMFRGVILPPAPEGGVNEVLFRYESTAVALGLYITVVSLLFALTLLALIPMWELLAKFISRLMTAGPSQQLAEQ